MRERRGEIHKYVRQNYNGSKLQESPLQNGTKHDVEFKST